MPRVSDRDTWHHHLHIYIPRGDVHVCVRTCTRGRGQIVDGHVVSCTRIANVHADVPPAGSVNEIIFDKI
jgi:hypothetical protein